MRGEIMDVESLEKEKVKLNWDGKFWMDGTIIF